MRFTWRFPGMSFASSLDAFVLCVLCCTCDTVSAARSLGLGGLLVGRVQSAVWSYGHAMIRGAYYTRPPSPPWAMIVFVRYECSPPFGVQHLEEEKKSACMPTGRACFCTEEDCCQVSRVTDMCPCP